MEGVENLSLVQQPLVNFFERVIGAQDLYGLMTTRHSVKDLVLAQKTTVTVSEIKDLLRAKFIERDQADEVMDGCPWEPPVIERMKVLYRADANYANLQNLTVHLGSVRQERKNLVIVTNLLPRWGPNRTLYERLVSSQRGGVPKTGIVRGRLTEDNRDIATNGRGGNLGGCMSEAGRLGLMDFEPRYRELMDTAKRENVSIYAITPSGLQAPSSLAGTAAMRKAYDDLTLLANETGGLAVTDTNDLNAGFRQIADDLACVLCARLLHDEQEVRRRDPEDHRPAEGAVDPRPAPVPRAHRGRDRGADPAQVCGAGRSGSQRATGRDRRAGCVPRQPHAAARAGEAARFRAVGPHSD